MAKKEAVIEKYVTGKGELTGFVALVTPSTKFNKEGVYSTSILLDKKEGEALVEKLKEIRKEQFKTYGKGTKCTEISCEPYSTTTEDGEEIPDSKGRYILKAKANAYIKDGKPDYKIPIINAKRQPVKNIKIGEGTIARLLLQLCGYSVAGKTGVSIKLKGVQIIDLVEFDGGNITNEFEDEEGFEGTGEEFEETLIEDEPVEDEEADF